MRCNAGTTHRAAANKPVNLVWQSASPGTEEVPLHTFQVHVGGPFENSPAKSLALSVE
jgi:hypothetical protein